MKLQASGRTKKKKKPHKNVKSGPYDSHLLSLWKPYNSFKSYNNQLNQREMYQFYFWMNSSARFCSQTDQTINLKDTQSHRIWSHLSNKF